ncbi:hypothetical protein B0H19DRAFT_47111 [Mycena capillaripes]|nr:hypothetical protein B0H19DRAFT_47111 [Mycena capillaripes]
MDQGTKRKRDSTIPTLVYSAPGYNRFAKLFTETSLDEIKEIVRKRLGLSSISDFTLFYDTDISLENDDDFDAFEVHSHSSASAVNVIVKILSPSHAPPAGPSVVSQSSGPVPLDVDMGGAKPPQKKRKVAADAPAKPISSAPKDKQKTSVGAKVAGEGPTKPTAPERSRRKSNAVPIEVESISTAHAAPGVASKEIERPGEEPPKKKRKKEAEKTSTASPVDTSSAKQAPDTATQERTKRKSKKAVEKGPSDQPNLPASSTVPSTANEIPEIRKVKSKKNPEPGLEPAPPKPTTSKKSTKPSKKDKQQTEDVPNADGSAQNPVKSVKFAEQLANTIENGLAQSEPVTASHQKSRDPPPAEKDSGKVTKPKGKKKIVEQDVVQSRQIRNL